MQWIRRRSISSRIFAAQLAAILLLGTAAVVVAIVDAQGEASATAGRTSLAVARSLAEDPFVRDAVAGPDPTAALQEYSVRVTKAAGVDFVTIMTPDGTRFTHPNPARIGERFLGSVDRALAGGMVVETYTGTLGRRSVPLFRSSATDESLR